MQITKFILVNKKHSIGLNFRDFDNNIIMFTSTQEKKATTANDIFEALDLGEKNVRFFIELCDEVPPEVPIN